jgi:hypothetical protein
MTRVQIGWLIAAAGCLSALTVSADELGVLVGSAHSIENGQHTGAYQLDYQRNLGAHLAVAGSHVNEGHATNDHRDGAALQLRAHTSVLDPRLTLTAGVGPFYYFNTTRRDRGSSDAVDHGWGVIFSLSATWNLGRSWYLQARVQHIDAYKAFDTTSVLVGGGYRFGGSPTESQSDFRPGPGPAGAGHEVSAYAGRVVANTFESQHAPAQAVEYRGRLAAPLEWTVTALNEGDTGPVRRYGIAAQLWGVTTIGGDRFSIGAGVGPYLLVGLHRNEPEQDHDRDRLAGIATLAMAYAVAPAWRIRLIFNRVFAEHSRDTDVLLVGIGYRY